MAPRIWDSHRESQRALAIEATICRQSAFAHAMYFVFLLVFAWPVFAQSGIPENAKAKSYGDGWECNSGFRIDGEICVAVMVPEHAFATNRTYGAGWECLHGFVESPEATCIAVVVPNGAYLEPSGKSWRCARGYR